LDGLEEIEFEANYDGDSDPQDSKSKLRRKLKKERKDAIMAGVIEGKAEKVSPNKRTSPEYAPNKQTTKNLSTEA
jgi:hypothetical protein